MSTDANDWTGMPRRPQGGPSSEVHAVDDDSQVGEARRAAAALAGEARLGETEAGALAVVVTEVATNLARHARDGRILMRVVGTPPTAGVELVVLDQGPGIANVDRALRDGFSTAGTAGQGLGAIRRMAHECALFTQTAAAGGPAGTVLVLRLWSAAARTRSPDGDQVVRELATPHVGAVCVPIAGETACGDAWVVIDRPGRTLVVVADGLGHGPDAAHASSTAIRVAQEQPDTAPGELLLATHAALRATRGAAIAIAQLDHERGQLTFAGVGNVAAAIVTPGSSHSLASHNGTVGMTVRKVQEFTHEWPAANATLLLHTDGVNTRWRMDAYPGALLEHPMVAAALLYRDAARGRDDATVVCVRRPSPAS